MVILWEAKYQKQVYRRKYIIIIFMFGSACLAALLTLGVLFVNYPAKFTENMTLYMTGRPLSICNLQVSLSDPIIIDMKDVDFANADWGTRPHMIHIGRLVAEIDRRSLLSSHIKLQKLSLDDFQLFLERDEKGKGNWKFGDIPRPHIPPNTDEGGPGRDAMPTIFQLNITNSNIAMRTSSGQILNIGFKTWALATPTENAPVTMNVVGSYNDIPVKLNITTDSFEVFHQSRRPFMADIDGNGGEVSLRLRGTMIDPLNFEQANMQLHVDSKNVARTAKFFHGSFDGNLPLVFDSQLMRQGDVWSFNNVTGSFANNPLHSGQTELIEGARLKPDRITTTLDFENLNLHSLMPRTAQPKPFLWPALSQNPGALLDIKLTAQHLTGSPILADHVSLHAKVGAGQAFVEDISAHILGGKAKGEIKVMALHQGNKITSNFELANADSAEVLDDMGVQSGILSGPLTAHIYLTAEGQTIHDYKMSTNGYAAFTLNGGAISTGAIQGASLDMKALFAKSSMVPMYCAVAVVDFKNGVGTFAPLRLESSTGAMSGVGKINLGVDTLDIRLQTDRETTGVLALDKPIHIFGGLNNIHVHPDVFSSENVRSHVVLMPKNQLAPGLQGLLAGNSCYR